MKKKFRKPERERELYSGTLSVAIINFKQINLNKKTIKFNYWQKRVRKAAKN